MIDKLYSQIFKRRSVRKFSDQPVSEALTEKILDFCEEAKPLHPQISVKAVLQTKEQVRFYLPWKAPQLLAVYSQELPGYLENVGFLFQQVDLYLQSLGLGCCWMGLGKVRQEDAPEGMSFVILLAFGHPQGQPPRQDISQFQRKALDQICDREDVRLEPARLAPSSTNSQPWYFTHEGEVLHAYRSKGGVLRHRMLGAMNRIDMGIALAHLYVAYPQTFRYFETTAPQLEGYCYSGSFYI